MSFTHGVGPAPYSRVTAFVEESDEPDHRDVPLDEPLDEVDVVVHDRFGAVVLREQVGQFGVAVGPAEHAGRIDRAVEDEQVSTTSARSARAGSPRGTAPVRGRPAARAVDLWHVEDAPFGVAASPPCHSPSNPASRRGVDGHDDGPAPVEFHV